MANFDTLYYPGTVVRPELTVSHIDIDEVNEDVAFGVLSLLTDAHESHFEDTTRYTHPLPRGMIREHYRPHDSVSVTAMQNRMTGYLNGGSIYLKVEPAADLSGYNAKSTTPALVKLSPTRPKLLQKIGLQEPDAFISDILVHPSIQGKGVGTVSLHAALKFGGFQSDRRAVLHADHGSVINEWFADLGLIEQPDVPVSPQKIGERELPQMLMVSARGITLESIVRRLERRRARLSDAKVVDLGLDTL